MTHLREAKDIPYLAGVRLLEGGEDDDVRSQFTPCQEGDPERGVNRKFKDKIEFEDRYVCEKDPRLQKHLQELFKFSGTTPPSLSGQYYGDFREFVQKKVVYPQQVAVLRDPTQTLAARLQAIQYIRENIAGIWCSEINGWTKEGDGLLRDALVFALQKDPSPLVRKTAAFVLGKTRLSLCDNADSVARVALRQVFKKEKNLGVRIWIARTPALGTEDLIHVVRDVAQPMPLREEALQTLKSHLFLWENRNSQKVWELFSSLLQNVSGDDPPSLRAIALGNLLSLTIPLSSHLFDEFGGEKDEYVSLREVEVAQTARNVLLRGEGNPACHCSLCRERRTDPNIFSDLSTLTQTWLLSRGYRGPVTRWMEALARL